MFQLGTVGGAVAEVLVTTIMRTGYHGFISWLRHFLDVTSIYGAEHWWSSLGTLVSLTPCVCSSLCCVQCTCVCKSSLADNILLKHFRGLDISYIFIIKRPKNNSLCTLCLTDVLVKHVLCWYLLHEHMLESYLMSPLLTAAWIGSNERLLTAGSAPA